MQNVNSKLKNAKLLKINLFTPLDIPLIHPVRYFSDKITGEVFYVLSNGVNVTRRVFCVLSNRVNFAICTFHFTIFFDTLLLVNSPEPSLSFHLKGRPPH